MAFQFPATPTDLQTTVNGITGSTYQWRGDLNKWVIINVGSGGSLTEIIHEGPTPPVQTPSDPIKLWYHTEELELYFYYTDVNGNSAWIPTSKPVSELDAVINGLSVLEQEVIQQQMNINQVENQVASVIYFGETAPTIYPDEQYTIDVVDEDANVIGEEIITEQNVLNYKFWLNTTNDLLSVLRIDKDADKGYSYQEVSGNPDLQEVLTNGNIANIPLAIETENGVSVLEDQALRITHQQNPYIRLVDEADGDALEITLNDDHGHIDMSDINDELHFKFGGIEKAVIKGSGDA